MIENYIKINDIYCMIENTISYPSLLYSIPHSLDDCKLHELVIFLTWLRTLFHILHSIGLDINEKITTNLFLLHTLCTSDFDLVLHENNFYPNISPFPSSISVVSYWTIIVHNSERQEFLWTPILKSLSLESTPRYWVIL